MLALNSKICTVQDDFIWDRFDRQARWVATLTNDVEVYQDDGRYAEKDNSWLRLALYCKENDLGVKRLKLQFRSNIQTFEGHDGYFLCFAAGCTWGAEYTEEYFIIGTLVGNKVHKTWWKVPMIEPGRMETESLEEILKGDFAEAMIINPRHDQI